MNDKKQIEEMAKEIARVLFEIRQDMTSVIRYIRHEVDKEKELYSNFTLGQFIDRHLKYRELADETSKNILKNLNENQKLKEIENLCVKIGRFGFNENFVVLTMDEHAKLVAQVREEFEHEYKESVVLTREEYERLLKIEKDFNTVHYCFVEKSRVVEARKETAREILQWLKEHTFDGSFVIIKTYFKEQYGVEVE